MYWAEAAWDELQGYTVLVTITVAAGYKAMLMIR